MLATGVINRGTTMLARLLVTVFLGLLAINSAQAANNSSQSFIYINNLIVYSNSDKIFPQWAGAVGVTFRTGIAWSTPTSCSNTQVAIRSTDQNLMLVVQTAWSANVPIRLFVDDSYTLPTETGVACYLRAVELSEL